MSMTGGQQIGKNQGKGTTDATGLALFLKVFGGEVLTAFERQAKTLDKVMVRTISAGKSAQFPVMGRTTARYLKQGESLDTNRKEIKHTEKVISIDGLLATDVLIYDIEDAMNHYDVRAEYSKQLGEALAMATDVANYAEMAKLVNARAVDTKNESIEGLGTSPLVMVGTKSNVASPAKIGALVIEALTMMRAEFTKRYIPTGDRYFYTSPDVYSAILAALMPNAANYAALIDPETGNIRNVMGFEVIETPHMTKAMVDNASDALDGTGHVFPATGTAGFNTITGKGTVGANNVCGLVCHRSAVGTLKLKDMALERARRPEYQADQIIARYAMGHGGLRNEAVGAITFSTEGDGVRLDKVTGDANLVAAKRKAGAASAE